MKKIIFIVFSSCFLAISCKEKDQSEEKISINPFHAEESLNLSELVDSVYYIKLETSSDCIISERINRIIIKEKYIYVVDVGQAVLFVFDKEGRFVSKLDKRGGGPQEYSFLSHVFVDDEEKYIDILDGRGDKGRILSYSNINFEYLNDRPLFIPSANSARREGDVYYFSTQQIDNTVNEEASNADVIVVKQDEVPKEIFKKKISTEGNYFTFNSESFTVNDNGEIFISLMYNSTFYKLSNSEAHEVMTIDFGKYGIDNSMGLKSTQAQMEYLQKSTEGLASFPVLHVNNASLLLFSYFFKEREAGRLHHFIDLKRSGTTCHVQNIKNDLTNFPEKVLLTSFYPVNHEVYHSGGYLVDIIIPSQAFEDRTMGITLDGVGIVKAEDNPVIMMMKLKKACWSIR